MLNPRQVAYDAVDKMIDEGLKKHVGESWRTEPIRMHILKAIGHLVTALRVIEGYSQPDGENHLDNGICRASMARSIELTQAPE